MFSVIFLSRQSQYHCLAPTTCQRRAASQTYFIAFMYVVIYHLEQEPHHIPQDEGGDQVPVDDIAQASDTPERGNTFKSSSRANTDTLIAV